MIILPPPCLFSINNDWNDKRAEELLFIDDGRWEFRLSTVSIGAQSNIIYLIIPSVQDYQKNVKFLQRGRNCILYLTVTAIESNDIKRYLVKITRYVRLSRGKLIFFRVPYPTPILSAIYYLEIRDIDKSNDQGPRQRDDKGKEGYYYNRVKDICSVRIRKFNNCSCDSDGQ